MIELKFLEVKEDFPDNGYDGRRFIFPYILTYQALGLGYDKKEEKRVIVSISKTTIKRWNYKNDDELKKVLFVFTYNLIEKKLVNNNILEIEKFDIPRAKYGEGKPFDPEKIVKY